MPLFPPLEGVDGRAKPGQDEVSRPISPAIWPQNFFGQPCRHPGIITWFPALAAMKGRRPSEGSPPFSVYVRCVIDHKIA
jgi:hypothetical protein